MPRHWNVCLHQYSVHTFVHIHELKQECWKNLDAVSGFSMTLILTLTPDLENIFYLSTGVNVCDTFHQNLPSN